MTQDPSGSVRNRATGLLAVALCLHEKHELMIMVVNSIMKGLKSPNYIEVGANLTAMCKLIDSETIPGFLPVVVQLLSHPKALVRKKAVMALLRFWQKAPDSIEHLHDKLRVVLCDRDPSVMAATLCIFHSMIAADPQPYRDLISSFVSILKQVSESRLSRHYDFHNMPAPWIQISIMQILAFLGKGNQQASEHMYAVLLQVIEKADKFKSNSGYAVQYEAVRVACVIHPHQPLLEAAAKCIGGFITLKNHNLKYLGIKCLASLVKLAPKFVAQYQLEVVECLESSDESLVRKTLDLLYRMTNAKNVVAITAKLLEHLRKRGGSLSADTYVKAELVSRISELAERYAPNSRWYIETMTDLFQVGGSLVRPEVAHNLVRLVAEGNESDSEAENNALRKYAVDISLQSLEESDRVLPALQVQVASWVLGEYGYLSEDTPLDDIVARLSDLLEHVPHEQPETPAWVMAGIAKLVTQLGRTPPHVTVAVSKLCTSQSLDLQQRAYEFLAMACRTASAPSKGKVGLELMGEVLPLDASCEDLELDPKLPFLNAYVSAAVSRGARKYIPAEARKKRAAPAPDVATGAPTKKELNFSYPAPQPLPQLLPLTLAPTSAPAQSTPATPTTQPLADIAPASLTPTPTLIPTPTYNPSPLVTSGSANSGDGTTNALKVTNTTWTKQGFVGSKGPASAPQGPSSAPRPSPSYTPPQHAAPSSSPSPSAAVPSVLSMGLPTLSPASTAPPSHHQKLASQLFGSLDGSDDAPAHPAGIRRTGSATSVSIKTRAASPPHPLTTSVSVTSRTDNLLDLDLMGDLTLSPSTHSAPHPHPPTTSTSSSSSMFASLNTRSSSAVSPRSSSAQPPSSPHVAPPSSDLLSLDFDLTPSPSMSSAHVPSLMDLPVSLGHGASSLMDGLATSSSSSSPGSGVLAPTSGLATQVKRIDNYDLPHLNYTPYMRSLLEGSNHSSTSLVSNSSVRVSLMKLTHSKDELGLVLLVSNVTQGATLHDVTCSYQLSPPDTLTAMLDADAGVEVLEALGPNTKARLAQLPPRTTLAQGLHLRFKKHTFQNSVAVSVSYSPGPGQAPVILPAQTIPIDLVDLLRPCRLQTEQVAAVWGSYSQSRTLSIQPSLRPIASARDAIDALNMTVVQIIGNEGIGASEMITTHDKVLVHAKTDQAQRPPNVEITVRTQDKFFTEVVTRNVYKFIR
eukprot:TRINITY_DN6977_c0_g1_i2.p1 TRINITY_DN6977_c0_g1~~TRINITY_DN6977_c0_g1_i2.p1  ORF type:complete len:1301 (-),score=435.89 TRINITY_DN6977_c0_g1_i2:44-3634(-)